MSDDYRLINTTFRDLRFIESGVPDIVIPKSGLITNVTRDVRSVYDVRGVPVAEGVLSVDGIPDKQEGVGYIVTWKTLMVLKSLGYDCSDLYCPDAVIRGDDSKPIGAAALFKFGD